MMGLKEKGKVSQVGLIHLYNYSTIRASQMMADPEYTRAIFVRDPMERMAIAYQSKRLKRKCCQGGDKSCMAMVQQRLRLFLDLIVVCDQPHWRPQGKRMESKFFATINFVGHMESIHEDGRHLLQSIGAWDRFGKHGWGGVDGTSELFADFSTAATSSSSSKSSTTLVDLLAPEFRQPYVQVIVNYFYQSDYTNEKLNLTFKLL